PEREREFGVVVEHRLEDPAASEHPVRARLDAEAAPDAVADMDAGHPPFRRPDDVDCARGGTCHHAEQVVSAGLSGKLGVVPEICGGDARSGLRSEELPCPLATKELLC